EYKNRDQKARWFSYVPTAGFEPELLKQPIETIFSPGNLRPGGFSLDEGTNGSDKYQANNTLVAGYLAASYQLSPKITASGGARLEYNRQQLESEDYTGADIAVDNPIVS